MRDWPTHGLQIDLGVDSHLGIPDQVDDPLFTLLSRQVQPRRQVATKRLSKMCQQEFQKAGNPSWTHVISILL
jgi:hypothetical protein